MPPPKNRSNFFFRKDAKPMNTCEIPVSSDRVGQSWHRFMQTRDKGTRDFLVEHYLPLVHAAAKRLRAKMPSNVDVEDLISAGTMGLMEAVDAFDPHRGVKFESFCALRIRGAILDDLRTLDWAPRPVRSHSRTLTRGAEALEAELGRPPTDQEVAAYMQWPAEKVQSFRRDTHAALVTSLDQRLPESDADDRQTLAGVLADNAAEDPSRKTLRDDVREILVRGLGQTERLIVILYYYEQLTLKEIGQVLDLSESRVSQLHSGVLGRLREQLQERGPEMLNDLACTVGTLDQVA
jgi:RNA polymerase sigma factor FliA